MKMEPKRSKRNVRRISMLAVCGLIIVLGQPQNTFAQWTTGTNINNTNTGNVGIGTASPLTKLHVAGGTRVDGTSGRVYLGSPAPVGARGLEFIEENATTFSIRHHDPNVAWRNIALNPYGGNVGIGTTNAVYTFDVNGGINGFRAKAATVSSNDTPAVRTGSGSDRVILINSTVSAAAGTNRVARRSESCFAHRATRSED